MADVAALQLNSTPFQCIAARNFHALQHGALHLQWMTASSSHRFNLFAMGLTDLFTILHLPGEQSID